VMEWITPFSLGKTKSSAVFGHANLHSLKMFTTIGDIGTSLFPALVFGYASGKGPLGGGSRL